MSGDSRSHLDRSTQRRFLRVFLVASAAAILILTPLILRGDWRLDLAHRFELVPGSEIEQVAGATSDTSLIVVPISATTASGRDQTRFHAAFLADTSGEQVVLTSIDSDRSVTLPLTGFDFFSASDDGRHVLFRDTRSQPAQGALVRVDTLEVTPMPSDDPYPTNIAGDWKTESWQTSPGSCGGISPDARFIACFQNPKLATYLAGDWQLRVLVYGDSDREHFENEEGIWVAPVTSDMFG